MTTNHYGDTPFHEEDYDCPHPAACDPQRKCAGKVGHSGDHCHKDHPGEDRQFINWQSNLDQMVRREMGMGLEDFGDAPTRKWFDAEESVTNAFLLWLDMLREGTLG